MTIQKIELLAALQRTERLIVRCTASGSPVEKITRGEALKLIIAREFTGSCRGRHGQVRSIRPVVDERPVSVGDSGQSLFPHIGYNMTSKGAGKASSRAA